MILVDIEKLDYETFNFGDDENPDLVDYISAKDLMDAPHVDPVNHAEWTYEEDRYDKSDAIYISHNCSNCGTRDKIESFKIADWDNYHKYHYAPKLSKFCRECGYKMDFRELMKGK